MCFKQYRSTMRISMIVNIGSAIILVLSGQEIFLYVIKIQAAHCPVTNTFISIVERIYTFHEKMWISNILNKHYAICLGSLHCYKLSILFQAQYFLFVSSQHILSNHDFLWVMNGKDDISLLLILRTREGLMFFITKLGLSPSRGCHW